MSLRDEGRDEECFEYDRHDEERKPTREQHETLDLVEEGNSVLCSNLILSLVMFR